MDTSLLEKEARGIVLHCACLVLTLQVHLSHPLINFVWLHNVARFNILLTLSVGCKICNLLLSLEAIASCAKLPNRLRLVLYESVLLVLRNTIHKQRNLSSCLIHLGVNSLSRCRVHTRLSEYLMLRRHALAKIIAEQLSHQSRAGLTEIFCCTNLLPRVSDRYSGVNLISVTLLRLTRFELIVTRLAHLQVALT
jgi:hypothetical protein